jgi:hypothetical protein
MADMLGAQIMRVREQQQQLKAGVEAPVSRSLLEQVPEWFPVRKLSPEESEQRRERMAAEAEAAATASRERWEREQGVDD